MGELKTREDVHALIAGLTLLGTGGGGRPEQGLDALLPHVEPLLGEIGRAHV